MLTALYADKNGEIYDAPGYAAAGRIGKDTLLLTVEDLIPMPEGAELMYLPGRSSIGAKDGQIMSIADDLTAVAAVLPVGYTRTHLPAFKSIQSAPQLPLYGYTAVALYQDQLYVAAVPSDNNAKWHPYNYNTPEIKKLVKRVKKDLPGNRIVEQVAGCSLKWHCCTAQNLFYRRWEAGIPTSPACNANCFGCISLQPSECCPSPQSRINFIPTAEEIAEVGIYHLSNAPEAIISFGQGCEGEPSLAADNIAAGIGLIRSQTKLGQININTNAGYTKGIKKIVDAGLDTMRVSIISARPEVYQAYYRSDYTLDDVKASIRYAKEKGIYVSLNMLSFPGLNDRPEEVAAWVDFLSETGVDMIQLRNLNVDPDAFLAIMPDQHNKPVGVRKFVSVLQDKFPSITIGSFSHYVAKSGE
ncbi:radical SAM protein [Dendrosporobacter sp. 1207_IL3150]|uniref:radical SAM protein n=1 Tax=Dendrosporobacter sp. 1207_IL3150 TaxID=3084054 RepID=UPI002FDA0CC1